MKNYALLSDAELTSRFNELDRDAFAQIYERYWGLLFSHARRMLRDDEQAGDVVQDVFLAMLKRMGSLDINSTLGAYLYQAVKNTIINHIEKSKVRTNYIESLKHFVQSESVEADSMVREKELSRIIEREIDALPKKMRKIFELSRRAHLSYKEIAQQQDVSEETVRKQIYKALKILRGKIGAGIFFNIMYGILLLNKFMDH